MPKHKLGDRAIHKTDQICPRCESLLLTLDEWQDHGCASDPTWYTLEERCEKCEWHYWVI